MGTTKDMLGQEPRVWLQRGWLVSQGTLAGAALAALAVEGARRNGNDLDESPGEPTPGNRAGQGQHGGRQAAPAAEIKGVDFTQEAPGRSGYPLGCAAGEPSLVIVSLIRSLKEPQQAGGWPPPPQTQVAIVEEESLFLYTVQMLSTCLQLGRKPCPVTDRCKVLYSLCLGLPDQAGTEDQCLDLSVSCLGQQGQTPLAHRSPLHSQTPPCEALGGLPQGPPPPSSRRWQDTPLSCASLGQGGERETGKVSSQSWAGHQTPSWR